MGAKLEHSTRRMAKPSVDTVMSSRMSDLSPMSAKKIGYLQQVPGEEGSHPQSRGQVSRAEATSQGKRSRIVRGVRAKELFLLGYQYILWKQCNALINVIGFPAQLENIVKDLWALRLQLLMKWMGTEHDQNKQYSSQTESNASEGNGKQSNRRSATPNLPETLALCYLAMMLLRLPTSIGDIHRWAIREDIPYVRAIRHVPDVIKQKLPAEYDNALDTISSVEPDDIRRAIHRTIIFYRQYFDLSLPALNFPLLLFKHVRNLGLPVNILSAVDCTAKLLSIEFRFPDLDLGRQSPVHLPEISLLSLIVIAVKLLCPFEAPPQFVESLNDPATLTINWLEWAQAQKEHKERLSDENHLPRGSEMQVTERDVLHMSDEQIDEYLDWYEKTFIDEERARVKKGAMAKQLLDMFPTGAARETPQESYHIQEYSEQERESLAKLIRQVHSSLGARFVMTRDQQGNCDKSQAVGSCYRQYRHPTDLTAHARIFHQAVADAGAIRLETLVRAVRQMERRLLRWCEHQKREHGWQSLSEPNHVRHRSSLETTGGSDMSDEDSDHVWEAEREDAARTTMDDLSDPGSPADVRSASSSGDEMSS